MSEPEEEQLGALQLVAQIGEGGFAKVFRGLYRWVEVLWNSLWRGGGGASKVGILIGGCVWVEDGRGGPSRLWHAKGERRWGWALQRSLLSESARAWLLQ